MPWSRRSVLSYLFSSRLLIKTDSGRSNFKVYVWPCQQQLRKEKKSHHKVHKLFDCITQSSSAKSVQLSWRCRCEDLGRMTESSRSATYRPCGEIVLITADFKVTNELLTSTLYATWLRRKSSECSEKCKHLHVPWQMGKLVRIV